jgi:hypothetical protein
LGQLRIRGGGWRIQHSLIGRRFDTRARAVQCAEERWRRSSGGRPEWTRAMSDVLQRGLEVHCPRCRQWHVVEQPYAAATTAEREYRYVTCGPHRYFVGQFGRASRWLARVAGAQTQKGGA